MNVWPEVKLGELLKDRSVSYGVVQPGNDLSAGIPIVRVKDIRNGVIETSAPMRIDPAISQKHNKTILSGGELLMTLVGTVGEVAVAPIAMAGWNVARAIAVIRSEIVSSRWLQLCIETPSCRAQIDSLLNTTVQATLNLADLRNLTIPMPPSAEREAIAEVLGALDDKIAANTALVETTEALSSAIYEAGKTEYMAAPLSDTADFVNGKAFTKGASGTGRVVVRIAELNSGLGGSTVYSDADVEDKHVAHPGDILFAWSGSLTLNRWYRSDAIINQHIFKVIPQAGYPQWLVYELIRSKLADFKSIAADKATTMGHIQRHHLDESVAVPSSEEIAQMNATISPLWERALVAEQESLTLAELRDTLLPELMSGRLRVKEAVTQVGEVV